MRTALLVICSLAIAAPAWAQTDDDSPITSEEVADPPGESQSYDSGDLGLDEIDNNTEPGDPARTAQFGAGINATLSPVTLAPGTPAILPASIGLRLWLTRLMIEPLLTFLLNVNQGPDLFGLGAGALIGFSLLEGNLRPIVGGGMQVFYVAQSGDNAAGFIFGPFVGIEYRFTEFPQLGFDASVYLPFVLAIKPVSAFQLSTAGSALIGFHYYF